MIVEWFLAIAFLEAMQTYKPFVFEAMRSRDACMVAAAKKNRTDADKLRELGDGATFVCLKVEKVTT